jgi:hypothetical protein
MDIKETVRRYFKRFDGKVPTPQLIRDAAASVGEKAKDIADIIVGHAESLGIDASKELADLYAAMERVRKEREERDRRARIKAKVSEIADNAYSLADNADTADAETLDSALKVINSDIAELTIDTAKVNRYTTWADCITAWTKDEGEAFSPELFGSLSFPEGTVSYIGARTGRGKTTAMVSLGVEALFPLLEARRRRILFITLEESPMQILSRFALCLAYKNADTKKRTSLDTILSPYTGKRSPKEAYKHLMYVKYTKGNSRKDYGGETDTFIKVVERANARIKPLMESGELMLYNAKSASLNEVLSAVRLAKRGDIVLVDYIQKMPGDKTTSGNPDLERIRKASEGLIIAAESAECIVIAGAQFNRESQKGNDTQYDTFTDADFRGCGDLEQDAHNAIGIGRNKERTQHYYGVIKSRELGSNDALYTLNFAGGYSYMSWEGELYEPKKQGKEKPGKEKQNDKPWLAKGMTEQQYIERDGWSL